MKKIYIASPYSQGDMALNVRRQMDCAQELAEAGFTPFIPMLIHFQHIVHPRTYEYWLNWGLTWLQECYAVIHLDGESSGADREVQCAREHKIPVFASILELQQALISR